MADLLPSESAVEARLRQFLAVELRQAELDFPRIPRRERLPAKRRVSIGIVVAAIAVLAFLAVAPQFVGRVFVGAGRTPMGTDGLPISIDGERVVRGDEIRPPAIGSTVLAGGALVVVTPACLSRSDAAQVGCVEGWNLVGGRLAHPSASFVLDGLADAPGFVRTSGALTVVRVHARVTSTGSVSSEVLVVESIAWRQPTKGRIPADAVPPEGGTANQALVPDFVSAVGRDGVAIAGYVPKRYVLEGGTFTPGSPSNPPQEEPWPVYGEDLTTLVGHMVPGVGFVALGSTDAPTGPNVSAASSSAAPSPSVTVGSDSASAGPSGIPLPTIADCGRITSAVCAEAIALARAQDEVGFAAATRIVVDDTCSLSVLCERRYPFDSIVVFVTAGADTTGWYVFHVFGTEDDVPTTAEPWTGTLPAHLAQRVQESQVAP